MVTERTTWVQKLVGPVGPKVQGTIWMVWAIPVKSTVMAMMVVNRLGATRCQPG